MAKRRPYRKRQRNAPGRRQSGQQHGPRRVLKPGQSRTTFGRNDLFIALGLVAVILTVYAQVMNHQFIILDDNRYIRENPMVNRGLTLTGIAWAFTTFHAANWHPLTWLSHMLDSQIFGLNAGGHLLVNALIHASNTVILFLFLRRVTGARWQSAIVAALFARCIRCTWSLSRGLWSERILWRLSSACSVWWLTPGMWRRLLGSATLWWRLR